MQILPRQDALTQASQSWQKAPGSAPKAAQCPQHGIGDDGQAAAATLIILPSLL